MFETHAPALFALTVLAVNATPGVDLLLTLSRTLSEGVRGGLAAACGIGAGCVLHAAAAAFGLAALLAASASAFTALKMAGALYLGWLAVAMLREAARRPTRASGSRAGAEAAARVEGGASTVSTTSTASTASATPATSAIPATSALSAQSMSTATSATSATAAPSAPSATPATRVELGRTFRQALLTNALNPKVAIFFLALLPQFIDSDAVHKTAAFVFLGAWFVGQNFLFLALFVMLVAPLRRWQPSSAWRRALQAGGGLLFAGLAARLALAERM